jgi:hypothetical protein
MGNIWKGDTTCVHSHFKNCTASEVGDLNSYMASFLEDMGRTPTFTKPGNGAFVESCLEHCGEQEGNNFDGYQLNGTTMQEAHSRWWGADEAEPAAAHTCVACDDNDMMLQLPPRGCGGKVLHLRRTGRRDGGGDVLLARGVCVPMALHCTALH